jgi:hypothetical protein
VTLAVQTLRQLFNGNGSTTVFAIPFAFSANDEVEVILVSSADVETVQTITTHYTISGSNVTMLTAPATGQKLLIRQDKDLEQQIADFNDQVPFTPTTAERAIDENTALIQQLSERVDRCLTFPRSSAHSLVEIPRTLVAGSVLSVNDAATAIEFGTTVAAITEAAASASAASSSATAAAASATAAATSATSAASSATSAASSATAAAASASVLSDGDKGDITVASSGASWTVDNNAISDAKLRDSTALSVIGRSANTGGDPADIVAANDGEVLRRSGTSIGFGTLSTDGLANDAVTYAKMQDVSATSRIIGRKTALAGDPEECTLSEILDFIGSAAQGDILYRGAAGWARLGAGTSGHFLQTQGAAANPQWAASSGGTTSAVEAENGAAYSFSAGYGTTSAVKIYQKRLGNKLFIRGVFTTGTIGAGDAYIVLPSGIAIDTGLMDGNGRDKLEGRMHWLQNDGGPFSITATGNDMTPFYDGSNSDRVYWAANYNAGAFMKQGVNTYQTDGDHIAFTVVIPVSGWNSST